MSPANPANSAASAGSTNPASPTPQIKAVLWDFGGVFTASPFWGLKDYAQSLGTQGDALRQIVFGVYGQDSDHPWHKLERGEQSMKDTANQIEDIAAQAGIEGFTMNGFFKSMQLGGGHGDGGPNDRSQVVDMVRRLKSAGIRNAIITNNIREFSDAWRKMIPVDELFEFVVDSSAEGVRKPNPKIYQLALERLGQLDESGQSGSSGQLPPAQAVFLDDVQDNVDAARQLGIHGIQVGLDPESALAELAELVGLD